MADLLKEGCVLTAFEINPNDPEVISAIKRTRQMQEKTLALKNVSEETLNKIITI